MQPGGAPDPAQGEGHPAAPSRCRRGHRFPGQPTAGPVHRRVCSLAQHRDPRPGSADAAPPTEGRDRPAIPGGYFGISSTQRVAGCRAVAPGYQA